MALKRVSVEVFFYQLTNHLHVFGLIFDDARSVITGDNRPGRNFMSVCLSKLANLSREYTLVVRVCCKVYASSVECI